MFERILLGVGRRMVPVPEWLLRPMVERDARRLGKRSALEPDQRRVQYFAVREIRAGESRSHPRPLPPNWASPSTRCCRSSTSSNVA